MHLFSKSCATIALIFSAAAAQAQSFSVGATGAGFSAGVDLQFLTITDDYGEYLGYTATLSPEYWAQYQFSNGIFIGAEYFALDATSPAVTIWPNVSWNTYDLKIGKNFNIGQRFSVSIAAGSRTIADFLESATSAIYISASTTTGYLGELKLKADVGNGFSVFGSALYSSNPLPEFVEDGFPAGASPVSRVAVTEYEIGVEYARALNNGNQIFAQLAWVSNTWNISEAASNNLYLNGFSANIGMSF